MAIEKVGVVGCGLMGAGIAQVCAGAGFSTVVREVTPGALDKGLKSIDKESGATGGKGNHHGSSAKRNSRAAERHHESLRT